MHSTAAGRACPGSKIGLCSSGDGKGLYTYSYVQNTLRWQATCHTCGLHHYFLPTGLPEKQNGYGCTVPDLDHITNRMLQQAHDRSELLDGNGHPYAGCGPL